MRSRPVLGIDPGGRWTGLCIRLGSAATAHQVITRAGDEDVVRGIGVGPVYIADVMAAIAALEIQVATAYPAGPPLIAVEGVTRPNPHLNRANGRALTDPTGILGTAMILGAVLATYPNAVIVPPGHNGERPLSTYPTVLVAARELAHGANRVGGGILRHARSAFDVAGQAGMHARLRAAKHAIPKR